MENKKITYLPWSWVIIGAMLILGFVLSGFWVYHKQARSLKAERYNELRTITQAKAASLAAWRKERLGDGLALALNPLNESHIRPFLDNAGAAGALQEFRAWLEPVLRNYGYEDAALVDIRGKVRMTFRGSPESSGPIALHDIGEALRAGRPEMTDFHSAAPGDPIHIDILVPLLGHAGAGGARRRVGALLLRIDPKEFLCPLIESWPTPSRTAESVLVRRDGDKAVLLSKFRHSAAPPLITMIPLSRGEVPAVQVVLGRRGMFEGRDFRGEKVLADMRGIPGSPWCLVSKVDADELLAEVVSRALVITVCVFFGILMTAGVFVLLNDKRIKSLYWDLAQAKEEKDSVLRLSQRIVNSIQEGIVLHSPDGRILLWNAFMERLTGKKMDEVMGKSSADVFPFLKSAGVIARIEQAMKGQSLEEMAVSFDVPGGKAGWVADNCASLLGPTGKVDGAISILRDITQKKKTELTFQKLVRVHAVLSAVTHAIVHFHEPKELFEYVCRIAAKQGCYRLVWVVLLDEATQVLRSVAQAGAGLDDGDMGWPNITMGDPVSGCVPAVEAIRQGRPVIVKDVATDPRMAPWREHALRCGYLSGAAFPFFDQGKPVGVICFCGAETSFFNDEEVGLLKELADRLSFALGSARQETAQRAAQKALLDSEGRFRAVVESLPVGIFVQREGRFLFLNPAMAWILGARDTAELVGEDLFQFVSPEIAQSIRQRISLQIETGQPAPLIEVQYRRRDGSRIWAAVMAMQIRFDGADAFLVSAVDISARKGSEDLQALRLAVFGRLADNQPIDGILADILRQITGALGIEAGGIRLRQGVDYPFVATCGYSPEFVEQERSLCPRAADGASARDAAGNILLECVCGGVLRGVIDRSLPCVTQQGSLWVNRDADLAAPAVMAPLDNFRSRCLEAGYQSRAFVPLRSNDKVVGLLYLADRREGIFTKNLIEYLEGLAISIAVAVDFRGAMEAQTQMAEQLRQAQKMESVGRLAGGVAHDFNNLLTAITGYSELLKEDLHQEDPKRADVNEILHAAERAAALTKQLLAFSRKQILSLQVLDLNSIVGNAAKMINRLIGEDITLETRLSARPCRIKADAGQLDQVLLNLAVNARDAMPDGGDITISTDVLTMPAAFFNDKPELKAGPLVVLSVSDTGCGMTEEVKARIFEPFFTTKGPGKGTGLGLATVYGIVKQIGGEISLESSPGQGASFKIYFPQTAADVVPGKDKDKQSLFANNESVLIVDDEDIVRRLGERTLAINGYEVISAANGPEALLALERRNKAVDLVVTDVVMPGMNGRDMAREIARRNMSRRTLFVSGYTDDTIVRYGVLEPGLAFMNKPYTPNQLLRKIREVLDGPADQSQP